MRFHLHDNTPANPGEEHGPRGPTHAASQNVDIGFPEFAEDVVREMFDDHEWCVRIECPEVGKEWRRQADGTIERVEPVDPLLLEVDLVAVRQRFAAASPATPSSMHRCSRCERGSVGSEFQMTDGRVVRIRQYARGDQKVLLCDDCHGAS